MRTSRKRHLSPNLPMPPALRYRSGIRKGKKSAANTATTSLINMNSQGMRQWLEQLLDEGSCNILSWDDRKAKIFRITWCHASRHDFDSSEHADLFIQYAERTGRAKLTEGSKNGYSSKLKSNFRSALHSLPDCVKVESKGESAVKLYKFLDEDHPEYKRRKEEKRKNQYRNKKGRSNSRARGISTWKSQARLKEEEESAPDNNDEDDNDEDDKEHVGDVAMEIVSDSQLASGCTLPSDDTTYQIYDSVIEIQVPTQECHLESSSQELFDPSIQSSQMDSQMTFPTSIIEPIVISSPIECVPSISFSCQGQLTVCKDESTSIEVLPQPDTSLPNFKVLEMESSTQDFYQAFHFTEPSLSCGGSVRVKKAELIIPQLELEFSPIPLTCQKQTCDQIETHCLTNLEHAHIKNDQDFETPFLTQEDIITLEDPHLQLLDFCSGSTAIPGDENEQDFARVTVVLENRGVIPQGENYDVRVIASMKFL